VDNTLVKLGLKRGAFHQGLDHAVGDGGRDDEFALYIEGGEQLLDARGVADRRPDVVLDVEVGENVGTEQRAENLPIDTVVPSAYGLGRDESLDAELFDVCSGERYPSIVVFGKRGEGLRLDAVPSRSRQRSDPPSKAGPSAALDDVCTSARA